MMMTAPSTIRPKVDRAQAHQIGADLALHHADGGHQHRQRDDQRGDEAARKLPSSRNSTSDDQQRALGEILRHRGDGGVDELGAVEHGLDLDAGGQRRR